jgi:hypothetical protein
VGVRHHADVCGARLVATHSSGGVNATSTCRSQVRIWRFMACSGSNTEVLLTRHDTPEKVCRSHTLSPELRSDTQAPCQHTGDEGAGLMQSPLSERCRAMSKAWSCPHHTDFGAVGDAAGAGGPPGDGIGVSSREPLLPHLRHARVDGGRGVQRPATGSVPPALCIARLPREREERPNPDPKKPGLLDRAAA